MRVFLEHGFFDPGICRRIRDAMDSGEGEPAEILTAGFDVEPRIRHTWTIDVDEDTLAVVEAALDACRPRIAAFHGAHVTEREGAGFLRYPVGGFYRIHRDRGHVEAWPAAAARRIATVVFLNDDFAGGELQLLPDDEPPLIVAPRSGTLVAFDAETLHEVLPVRDGTRDTIVDWYLDF
jgi:SM-20-related protein